MKNRHQLILDRVKDAAITVVDHGDKYLIRGEVAEAIVAGEIGVEDMVRHFRQELCVELRRAGLGV